MPPELGIQFVNVRRTKLRTGIIKQDLSLRAKKVKTLEAWTFYFLSKETIYICLHRQFVFYPRKKKKISIQLLI